MTRRRVAAAWQSWPAEFVEGLGSTRDRQQHGLTRPAHVGAVTASPVDVGCGQSQSSGVLLGRQNGYAEGKVEDRHQAVGRDRAGQAESPPDVLVVDRAVSQRDPTAKARWETAGPQVARDEIDDGSRLEILVPLQGDIVDPAAAQATAHQGADQTGNRELVVADDVRGHVTHPPLGAQRRRVPLLSTQLLQQSQQISALLLGQHHQIRLAHDPFTWARVRDS